jgi:hypothetical protein
VNSSRTWEQKANEQCQKQVIKRGKKETEKGKKRKEKKKNEQCQKQGEGRDLWAVKRVVMHTQRIKT